MKNKNAYLERQGQVNQKFLDVGEQMGMQKMWDYMQIALRDPDVMGKDIIGRGRLEKLFNRCKELADEYHTAFTDDVEADYKQEQLDRALKEVWGDDFNTFYERYPYLKQFGYNKPHKKWR